MSRQSGARSVSALPVLKGFVLVTGIVAGVIGVRLAGLDAAAAAEPIVFETRVLDPQVGQICYAVCTADVDGDKRPDVVAVTENRVVWFANPDFKLKVIIENQTDRDNVCIAPHDIDGDGQIDFALGAGWTKIGTISWLRRGTTLAEPWKVHLIGQEGWTHRLRWGDLLGRGRPQLIVSPLNKTVAERGVRLLAFEPPTAGTADFAQAAWKQTVLDESLNAMHNHWVTDLNGDGRDDVVTSSQEGVFLFSRAGDQVQRIQLAKGAESLGPLGVEPQPKELGNGEIKVGKLGPGRPFLATVAPMHGRHVVVYLPPDGFPAKGAGGKDPASAELWRPVLLESGFNRGHAIGIGDFDGDGRDEVIAGHSDKASASEPGVYLFRASEASGEKWEKQPVDAGGVATEDVAIEDLNGDGVPDIIAGGRATHNVKAYFAKPTRAAQR